MVAPTPAHVSSKAVVGRGMVRTPGAAIPLAFAERFPQAAAFRARGRAVHIPQAAASTSSTSRTSSDSASPDWQTKRRLGSLQDVPMRRLDLPGSLTLPLNGAGNGLPGTTGSNAGVAGYEIEVGIATSNGKASAAINTTRVNLWDIRPSNGKSKVEKHALQPGASVGQPGYSNGVSVPNLQPTATAHRLVPKENLLARLEGEPRELQLDTSFRWARDDYSATRRAVDIWTFILSLRSQLWALDKPWAYPGAGGMTPERRSERARALAIWSRESILQLGPTFIKIGQLFSTRSDILPMEFTEELSKLQDRVPAFPSEKAVAIIERDLGASVESLFASFDRRPIAAASLGQVHRARLWSGEEVVVKVQRPGLRALFDIDLAQLRVLAEQLDRGDEARDFVGIYSECAAILYEEIDYINEGRNADRFRRNFKDEPWLRAPVVYWQFSSPRVLALQYLPGIKITDTPALAAAGLPLRTVARRATEAYLIQLLKHGFLHSDPHPGNLAVEPGSGALIFYDFGMMSSIVPGTREQLMDLFYATYRKDADGALAALAALGILVPTGDRLALRRAIAYFLDNLAAQTQRQETLSRIGEDLFAIALDQPFRFPATFTFVLRALTTLEGIGKALDPDYKFAAVAQPYAQELLQLQDAGGQQAWVLETLQAQASELGSAAAAVPARVKRMDELLAGLERGEVRLRVRVLEAERAARRAGVMQEATISSVAAVGLLNLGLQLGLAGRSAPAAALTLAAAAAGVNVALKLRRVKRLDQFEKDIRR